MEQLGQCVKFKKWKNTQRETAGTDLEQPRRDLLFLVHRFINRTQREPAAERPPASFIVLMEPAPIRSRSGSRPGTAPARFALFGSSVHQYQPAPVPVKADETASPLYLGTF